MPRVTALGKLLHDNDYPNDRLDLGQEHLKQFSLVSIAGGLQRY